MTYEPALRYQSPDLKAYSLDEIDPESTAAQTPVYVPIDPDAYYDGVRPCLLEATLNIRNTNFHGPIYVRSANYYDTDGQLVKKHLNPVIRLGFLESIEFLVAVCDMSGGPVTNLSSSGSLRSKWTSPSWKPSWLASRARRKLDFPEMDMSFRHRSQPILISDCGHSAGAGQTGEI